MQCEHDLGQFNAMGMCFGAFECSVRRLNAVWLCFGTFKCSRSEWSETRVEGAWMDALGVAASDEQRALPQALSEPRGYDAHPTLPGRSWSLKRGFYTPTLSARTRLPAALSGRRTFRLATRSVWPKRSLS